MDYYGIFDNTVGRWIVDGNSLVHYPQRDIAEAHLLMIKSKHSDFVVKQFGEAGIQQKKKTK